MGAGNSKVEPSEGNNRIKLDRELRFLTPRQIEMIDEMLDNVTPFGEVTLRVQKGRLRCIAKSKSYDAIKIQRPASG
jgi:hypothetical protein